MDNVILPAIPVYNAKELGCHSISFGILERNVIVVILLLLRLSLHPPSLLSSVHPLHWHPTHLSYYLFI